MFHLARFTAKANVWYAPRLGPALSLAAWLGCCASMTHGGSMVAEHEDQAAAICDCAVHGIIFLGCKLGCKHARPGSRKNSGFCGSYGRVETEPAICQSRTALKSFNRPSHRSDLARSSLDHCVALRVLQL